MHEEELEEVKSSLNELIKKEKLKNSSILEISLQQEKQNNEKERAEIRREFQNMFNER